ncbi:MAG: asparagine synthase (glutamine-hydrolyzing) [Proteobacteria bacterium]|nr:asparagine synthase (glutamine-hydrolyzing) [Pseudomonadota bacterium]
MCGIAGVLVSRPRRFERDIGRLATESMAHRGPDGKGERWFRPDGTWHDTKHGDDRYWGALFHRRLAIIDLSPRGLQPMASSCGRYHITFNGEIYNYRELRDLLAATGTTFASESDTEVILAAYARWGDDCVKQLVGMFAFCLIDLAQRRFLLARDQFGIKPMLLRRWCDGLVFASEPSALYQMIDAKPRISADAAARFLVSAESDIGAETFFEDVRQLRPGSLISGSLDAPAVAVERRYWQLSLHDSAESTKDRVTALRDAFMRSVELHVRADVPIGLMLSGGIDSSAIACTLRHLFPQSDIHTFTYIPSSKSLSEEHYANIVGKHIGALTHTIEIDDEQFPMQVETAVGQQGEPFGGPSSISQWSVHHRVAAQGIKVLLSGQGADEMLCGYQAYRSAAARDALRSGQLRRFFSICRTTIRQAEFPEFWQLAARDILTDRAPGLYVDMLMGARFRGILSPEAFARSREVLCRDFADANRSKPVALRELLVRETGLTHLPSLLRIEDRNSMSASIESRTPFLTTAMADAAFALAPRELIDDRAIGKAHFREAMRGIVPDAILDRVDKQGFRSPEASWSSRIRSRVVSEAKAYLERGGWLIDRQTVDRWDRAGIPSTIHGRIVWRLYNFLAWTRLREIDVTA